jgi:hypothetical protein
VDLSRKYRDNPKEKILGALESEGVCEIGEGHTFNEGGAIGWKDPPDI